jgi:hypothetical protein
MNDLLGDPIDLNLSAEQMSDRELLEDIHRMLVALRSPTSKPKPKAVPKARHKYEPEFEAIWKAYPARNGSNPKWKAQQAWRARVKEVATPGFGTTGKVARTEMGAMLEGTQRYAAWCEATGKTGTEMVMQTARFLGPSREYKNAWKIPEPEAEVIKLPRDNDELVAFAAKMDIHPAPGESFWEFRQRVENAL